VLILCDIVCQLLVEGRFFTPGTPASSTGKTDRYIYMYPLHVKNETSQIKNQPPLVHYKEELIHMEININFWTVIFIQQTNLYCVNIFIRFELFHSSSDSEEELIPIALRILGIFLVMNFL
jgi:hypothetical protein